MLELYEIFLKLKHEPVKTGTIIAIIAFIIDRLFKQLFIRQVRLILRVQDRYGVEYRVERLESLERKIDVLLKENGIEWREQELARSLKKDLNRGVWRNGVSLWPSVRMSFGVSSAVNNIKYFGRGVNKMKINKAILLPLLSAIVLFIKQAFNYDVPIHDLDMAANVILFIITVAGTFIHPHEKKERILNDEIHNSIERSE